MPSLIPTDPRERQYLLLGLRIVGDFGATIALPVVGFVFIGQKLDGRYGTHVLFTIVGFAIAALVSGKLIYQKAKAYGKQYRAMGEEEKKKRL